MDPGGVVSAPIARCASAAAALLPIRTAPTDRTDDERCVPSSSGSIRASETSPPLKRHHDDTTSAEYLWRTCAAAIARVRACVHEVRLYEDKCARAGVRACVRAFVRKCVYAARGMSRVGRCTHCRMMSALRPHCSSAYRSCATVVICVASSFANVHTTTGMCCSTACTVRCAIRCAE